MPSTNFAETYSKFSDDELLNLAVDRHSLTEDARSALSVELAGRKLTESDVAERRDYLATVKPGRWLGTEEFVARSFNGFGTAIYGKRDFWPDNSFLTTKWIVLFWIPLVPLRSMRLRRVRPGRSALPVRWASRYHILSRTSPDARQVLYVYGFVASLIVLSVVCVNFSLPEGVEIILFAALCGVPWLVRKTAKVRTDPKLPKDAAR